MELRYAVMCDFFTQGHRGKTTIVNTFDTVYHVDPSKPIVLPRCFLVASFDASVAEGSSHKLTVRLLNADGDDVMPLVADIPLTFTPRGPGYPLRADFYVELVNIRLPDVGDYDFELVVSGTRLGRVGFYVVRPAGVQAP